MGWHCPHVLSHVHGACVQPGKHTLLTSMQTYTTYTLELMKGSKLAEGPDQRHKELLTEGLQA
jgi:hypothetical protein